MLARARNVMSGTSESFNKLLHLLLLERVIRQYNESDKFYEMTVYRFQFDPNAGRVVKVESPPKIPIKIVGYDLNSCSDDDLRMFST